MILPKTGHFETLNPISKPGNVPCTGTLENIGRIVLPVCKQLQMRGSRCILGSGNIIKWTMWLMRRHTLNFGSISSHVFVKSSFSLSYSFTLDMHLIGQPRSLSLLLCLGKKDQPSHLTCNLQRRAFFGRCGGVLFPSLMWLLKNPRKKSLHFFAPCH